MRFGQIRGKTLSLTLGVHLKGNVGLEIQVTLTVGEGVMIATRVTQVPKHAREVPLAKPVRQKRSETQTRIILTGGRIEPIKVRVTDILETSVMMDTAGVIKITTEVIMIGVEVTMITVTGKLIDTINGTQIGTGRNKGKWMTRIGTTHVG